MYFNSENKFYHGIMFHHFHDNKLHKLQPTSFVIFDSNKVHCAQDIKTDKKRFAIDYAVKKV